MRRRRGVPGHFRTCEAVSHDGAVIYSQMCPRCGQEFNGDDKNAIADAVVEHALVEHRHTLDHDVVLSHLEGVHPHERDG